MLPSYELANQLRIAQTLVGRDTPKHPEPCGIGDKYSAAEAPYQFPQFLQFPRWECKELWELKELRGDLRRRVPVKG
jgi:hypothetical protein